MSFFSIPYQPLRPRATEMQLEAIYAAAKLGMAGDNLAHSANMLPVDYARLRELDPMVEQAEAKGRADDEAEQSENLRIAAMNPKNWKAGLAVLQNKHGWFAKQQIDVNIDERISVTVALERARSRVIDAEYKEVIDDQRTPAEKAMARLALVQIDDEDMEGDA